MSSTTRWRALRRAAAVVAGTTVLAVIGAGVAAAEVSPSKVTLSSTTLYWNGQGSPVQQQCGTSADPGAGGFQNGATANNYELWIFATDGGSVQSPPTLTINGTTYGNAFKPNSTQSDFGFPGAWQIVTPYIDPSTIQQGDGGGAFTSFAVNTTGGGTWVLTISHGCAGNTGPPDALKPTIDKTANGTFDTTYTWGIKKDVDHNQFNVAGNDTGSATANYTVTVTHSDAINSNYKVSGVITVTNPNSVPVDISGLTDTLAGGSPQTISGPATLQPGDTTFPYSFDLGDTAPSSATLDDTATVAWDTQDLSDGSHLAGNTASKTANTGPFKDNVTNQTVTVTDPLSGNQNDVLGTVDATQTPSGDSPPAATFTYSHKFTDPAGTCTKHDNTATIKETGQSDSQTVTVCVGKDLAVSKTATPSFDRSYAWDIKKSVDKTKVNQVGGSATFNYTVAVHHDSGTDGNWKVTGTITITNPNDWEDISVTSLDDVINNGGNGCTLDQAIPQQGLNVPAGGKAQVDYTCTYGSAPSPSAFTNTATAHWNAAAASTTNDHASGSASGDFANASPNLIDEQIAVNDSYAGTLGTVSVGDSNPKNLTYSRTIAIPQFNCLSYNNTATFTTNDTGTTGSSSQTVKVCGPLKTGALTIGYWQNKNGQGYITTGASTAGVCNSGTWLRQYAPFNETALSATATCAQVGTYVTNVIKAANAGGATMNAMLKAQMLATALDVYFSDPALGGNKINAPAPIGGVSIDLTMICKMIDGSGGTATCSGTYQNTSSAFGGASSLTVSQILAYAASQSNVGGSVWYSQVKATQELAKNTFDTINNQVAFAL